MPIGTVAASCDCDRRLFALHAIPRDRFALRRRRLNRMSVRPHQLVIRRHDADRNRCRVLRLRPTTVRATRDTPRPLRAPAPTVESDVRETAPAGDTPPRCRSEPLPRPATATDDCSRYTRYPATASRSGADG